MKRFQFSIASLLGVVVAVAFGIAALRSATDAWDSSVLGITLFTLLVAVLLAVHRTVALVVALIGGRLSSSLYGTLPD